MGNWPNVIHPLLPLVTPKANSLLQWSNSITASGNHHYGILLHCSLLILQNLHFVQNCLMYRSCSSIAQKSDNFASCNYTIYFFTDFCGHLNITTTLSEKGLRLFLILYIGRYLEGKLWHLRGRLSNALIKIVAWI